MAMAEHKFWRQLRRRWRRVHAFGWALFRVLWASRVSVFGLLLPAALIIGVAQARDLFSYFAGQMVPNNGFQPDVFRGEILTILYWSAFTGLTAFFWCYPVHFSARILLYEPDWLFRPGRNPSAARLRWTQMLYRGPIIWLPRVLGSLPFLALALGCWRARRDVPSETIGALQDSVSSGEITAMLWLLQWAFVLAGFATFGYLSGFRSKAIGRRASSGAQVPRSAGLQRRYRAMLGDPQLIARDVAIGRLVLAVISVVLIALLVAPSHVTGILFLALVLPVVAGGWVPAFTWLARWGHRLRLPLITATLAGLAWLTFAFGDNHDVRQAGEPMRPRLDLATAVERWKAANCNAAGCPQPIIVSSAGGASRAAFFTATVLGDLMDNPSFHPLPGVTTPAEKARHVVRRIFAISGVSGGSVGAAVFAGAVANSPDGDPPCVDRPSGFWFRAGAPQGWRGCLQAILAEDYLSETIVGLAFRDNLNFLASLVHWPDRAATLEDSWIAAFSRWVRPPEGVPLRGMDQPFTSFGPAGLDQGAWQPLLVLNGTSASTGRRILTTQLDPVTRGTEGSGQRLFIDAYDLLEIVSGEPACMEGQCRPSAPGLPDVTLASAASNSARFPIISPPGSLRRCDGQACNVVDRIIDGGYFENDGVTTTIDLVRALRQAGLRPAVIHIANDPLPYPRAVDTADGLGRFDAYPWRQDGPAVPDAEDRSWFLFLRGPLGGLLATRGARASYALRQLEDELESRDDFAEILVFGEPLQGFSEAPKAGACNGVAPVVPGTEMKTVSMSWWLSQPVQEYLDTQLKLAKNCVALDQVRDWLAQGLAPAVADLASAPRAAARTD